MCSFHSIPSVVIDPSTLCKVKFNEKDVFYLALWEHVFFFLSFFFVCVCNKQERKEKEFSFLMLSIEEHLPLTK
jgi:hypothetical protein